MLRQHARLARVALLFADGSVATILFLALSMMRLGPEWMTAWGVAGAAWWVWAAGYGVLWIIAEWSQELDQLRSRWTFRGEATDIVRAALVLAVATFSILFLVQAPDVSRLFLVTLFVVQVLVSIAHRRVLRAALILARNHNVGTRNLVVLGTERFAVSLARRLERHPALGYRVVGHLGASSPACPIVLGHLDSVASVIHDSLVDEVVAALAPDELAYLEPVVALCQEEGKRLRIVLQPGLAPLGGGRLEAFGDVEILTISNGPDRMMGLAIKRLLDIAIASTALVVLSPVLVAIGTAVWLEDRGPVLFRQQRGGRHGRGFRMLKFRSMIPDAEARVGELVQANEINGPAFKLSHDPRITRVGNLLRRTSLDELPQFWNVLKGEMSVVGPRPPIVEELSSYDLWHRRRLSMKPGITGLWQVSARLEAEFDRWVELDLRYIDRWSLWLDFTIMLRTLPAMMSGR
jgi:exopolysaccharide biosynthesis polyprenyl glycosylphosphotransferase